VYVHPYEFDPSWAAALRHPLPLSGRIRVRTAVHNAGERMEQRFRHLLRRWTFQTAREAVERLAVSH
jgi:hypothetical protein